MPIENPLLSPSPLPYGLPDYSVIRPEHYLPAFEAAFAEHAQEVAAITRVRSMPTFENTLVALETSGKLLGNVARTFYTVSSADATPEIQEIEEGRASETMLNLSHSVSTALRPAEKRAQILLAVIDGAQRFPSVTVHRTLDRGGSVRLTDAGRDLAEGR